MKEIILLKSGEIALKGLNRHTFEDVMIKNIRRRLSPLGSFKIWKSQSTTYVSSDDNDFDMAEAQRILSTVFGIAALCRACTAEKDFEDICTKTVSYLKDVLSACSTFKVEAKRSDKSFPMKSPEICNLLGGYILDAFPNLRVDVIHPQVTVTVEIRESAAYIHTDQIPGAGGMPVGTSGKGLLLLSGGIDSPVAGYMMAKRGLRIDCVHFAAPPYTSDRARQKVIDLARELTPYTGTINLFIVPFTHIQELLRDKCKEDYFTIVMRRYMIRIAQLIAQREDCGCLITGESIAQVASQTLGAIACTDAVAEMPVFRPVIGMDKEEIIAIARKIDTFETSILPYEDCCTVFTPRHPKTKPKLSAVEAVEADMELDELLIKQAAEDAELLKIYLA